MKDLFGKLVKPGQLIACSFKSHVSGTNKLKRFTTIGILSKDGTTLEHIVWKWPNPPAADVRSSQYYGKMRIKILNQSYVSHHKLKYPVI